MYTEIFGRTSYLALNTHRKRSNVARALLQPLSVLEMEVEHLNNRDLHRIKEAKAACAFTQLQCNPYKNATALFLSEALYRIIQEQEANQPLFDYLYRSIQLLNTVERGIGNFHLTFLLQLSVYLGIRPNGDAFKSGCFFDLLNGVFTERAPEHAYYLNKEDSVAFDRLLRIRFENMSLYSFSRQERANILRHIMQYYKLHLFDFPEIKSLAVMQSLFD
jgi:DNA repair protein RecO (recombination protein O)